ncbi:unannotated protein [freshwater metagenome]|uniref:Unannotated protein n=1 Tax=freshwater metagenome TaxID=449393 RepID=A0A6J7GW74_9ZZZZ
MWAALEVGVGGLVRGDHARAGAGLDRHVADGHAALHGERPNGRSAVFEHVALAAVGTNLGDHGQDDVFGANAGAQRALNVDGHGLEGLKRQGLRGQHVLNLAGTDADRHGAKSAVRGGVRVAADHGDAGHGESQLRAHHVHDALLDVAQRVQANAKLFRVRTQGFNLNATGVIGNALIDVERGGVVVFGGDGEIGATHRTTGLAQSVERLRARDLVHQVQVDVNQVGRAVSALGHEVVVPNLLGQGARASGTLGRCTR